MAELDLGRVVGADGKGLPAGGAPGQVLKKRSATDYDAEWGNEDLGLTGASVGDLVRVNAVDENGKPTSWKHVPLNEIKTNRNLLDNWYFVGGGSQLGDGVFPINQRGQTVYSTAWAYAIDRWKIAADTANIVISTDCLTVTDAFVQVLSSGIKTGTTLTCSILLLDGTLLTGANTFTPGEITSFISARGIYAYFDSFSTESSVTLKVDPYKITVGIVAIKLERGSYQTLAHKENGVWVLNEIPDYGEELRKCQRYFVRYISESQLLAEYRTGLVVRVYFPISNFSGTPSLSHTGNGWLISSIGLEAITFTATVSNVDMNGINVDLTINNTALTGWSNVLFVVSGYFDFIGG